MMNEYDLKITRAKIKMTREKEASWILTLLRKQCRIEASQPKGWEIVDRISPSNAFVDIMHHFHSWAILRQTFCRLKECFLWSKERVR